MTGMKPLGEFVAAPEFERGGGPGLRCQPTVVVPGPVLRSDRHDTRRVIRLAPREDALHVRRAHAYGRFAHVPGHLEGGVAEHGAVQFGFEIKLRKRIRRLDFAQYSLGSPRALAAGRGIAVARLHLHRLAVQQVARDLIDQRLRVVEGQPTLAATRPALPLAAAVEREVVAVAAQAVLVHALQTDGQWRFDRGRQAAVHGQSPEGWCVETVARWCG